MLSKDPGRPRLAMEENSKVLYILQHALCYSASPFHQSSVVGKAAAVSEVTGTLLVV